MQSTDQKSLETKFADFRDNLKELVEIADFSILTWLAFGAALQLCSQSWLPANTSYWLPLVFLIYKIAKMALGSTRAFTGGSFKGVKPGRWWTILPQPGKSELTQTNNGVVMFILCARLNHPLGKLAPGNPELNTVFQDMWKEAEKNRDKWSYLGRSATLFDTSDEDGITTFWLSYWKDLKGLQEFATSAAHRIGVSSYNKKKFPWVGIGHETYFAPQGHWECIYDNMPPIGMGKVSPVISKGPGGFVLGETLKNNIKKSTMYSRMGRGPAASDLNAFGDINNVDA